MNEDILCQRNYLNCKGKAEGIIYTSDGARYLCRKCLERGEARSFMPFK